jgi:hydroxyacylglutathione hydrolase
MFQITPVPAFRDNYIWVLHEGGQAVVVDPGDAAPVRAFLHANRLTLAAILNTHHHADHIGGNADLLAEWPVPVYAPARETVPTATVRLGGGDRVLLPGIDAEFEVLDVPGHTAGHIAYVGHGVVFCGDTLFACGCGRVFEGTPAQMHESLARLAALPGASRVYCAHEYTASNVRFARAVEPDHAALRRLEAEVAQARAAGRPTVPSTIEAERATNPFLRCTEAPLAAAVARESGADPSDPVAVFAALREWKNRF